MHHRKPRSSLPLDLVPSPKRVDELVARFGMDQEIRECPGRAGYFRVWKPETRRYLPLGRAVQKRELELARAAFAKKLASAEAANDLRTYRELQQLAGLRSTRPPLDVAEIPILPMASMGRVPK